MSSWRYEKTSPVEIEQELTETTPADPDCKFCKGSGKIQLIFKSVDCECVTERLKYAHSEHMNDERPIEIVSPKGPDAGQNIYVPPPPAAPSPTPQRDLFSVSKRELVEAYQKLKSGRPGRRSTLNAGGRPRGGGYRFSSGGVGFTQYAGQHSLPPYAHERIPDIAPKRLQQIGGNSIIEAKTAGTVSVMPMVSPYFEPKAVSMFAVDPENPSIGNPNAPKEEPSKFASKSELDELEEQEANAEKVPWGGFLFTIGAVTVGGSPMLPGSILCPTGNTQGEILSVPFSRPGDPLEVDWSVFSTCGLARELIITVFNINPFDVQIFVTVYGNPVTSLDCY